MCCKINHPAVPEHSVRYWQALSVKSGLCTGTIRIRDKGNGRWLILQHPFFISSKFSIISLPIKKILAIFSFSYIM